MPGCRSAADAEPDSDDDSDPAEVEMLVESANVPRHSGLLDDGDQSVHYLVQLRFGDMAGAIDDNARIGRE
jgi:hypothetical protein